MNDLSIARVAAEDKSENPRAIHASPNTVGAAKPPCFIHSSWRTGKTWFSLLFRHFPEVTCYYEPFHEMLSTLTPTLAVQLDPRSWESGHPSRVSYWREYIALLRRTGGVRLFNPSMSYEWFVPIGGVTGDLKLAEVRYLAFLIRHAQRRHQLPVLGFARSLGRVQAIKKHFPGNHIVVIRNLWSQWASYIHQQQNGNQYFVKSIFRMIGYNDDLFLEYLRKFYIGRFSGAIDETTSEMEWQQRTDQIVASLSESDLFSLFVATHVYFYLHARSAADVLIDSTRLAADKDYREASARELREITGLQISLTDVKDAFQFGAADENTINRKHIDQHVSVALNLVTGGRGDRQLNEFAEQLLASINTKISGNSSLEQVYRKLKAAERVNHDLQGAMGEREAALTAAAERATASEAGLAEARAELEGQRARVAELERDRSDRATALTQLEAEAVSLRSTVGEREAALTAAAERATASEAGLAEARVELEGQRARVAELERDRSDRAAALAQLGAEAAGLRATVKDRDSALAATTGRAALAEARFTEARAELEGQRARVAELERDRSDRATALTQLEAEAVSLRSTVGEREAALTAAAERATASEAGLAEARAELEGQRARVAELERDRSDRAAALAQLGAEAAGLRATVKDRDSALAATTGRAALAEARFTEARAELEGQRARVAELERDRSDRATALTQLEAEAVSLRSTVGEREAALTAAAERATASEAGLAEARAERGKALARFEHEAAEMQARLAERDAALARAEARASVAEAATAEVRTEVTTLRSDFLAGRQVANELIAASTADLVALQNPSAIGNPRWATLGFGRAMRAQAIKAGDRARDAKLWQIATRYYRRALARDPRDAAIWAQYGHALKETGRWAEAETAYRRSLACEPLLADTHLQLGHVLKLQGRMPAAQAAYLRAFALDPALPYPTEELTGLGWSPTHLSRLRELSESPGITQLRSMREAADAARDQKDWPNAARLYAEIVAADPIAHDIAVQLGHAYKGMGDIERAAQVYYSVLKATPADDDLHLQIGHVEKLRRNFAEAAAHYKKAVEINPENADAARECEGLRSRVVELRGQKDANTEPAGRQVDRTQSSASRSLASPVKRLSADLPGRSSHKKIYFVVQGLFLKSDSIGHDCAFQYKLLKEHQGDNCELRIFAETFDAKNYPDIPVDPIDELIASVEDLHDTTLIYHFCEGWDRFHEWLPCFAGDLIIRWHNNTPPWFFAAAGSIHYTEKTLSGFNAIVKIMEFNRARFWCNSAFTAEQLEVLGVDRTRTAVVYPGSRFILERLPHVPTVSGTPSTSRIRLLFVSRLAPHKGHRHVLPVAAIVAAVTRVPVTVTFPGRVEGASPSYTDEIRSLTEVLGIDLEMPGEVSYEELRHCYDTADVFVCLSEHEGFGIPLFEAVQSGLPVVAYAATAMREFISDHPLSLKCLNYAAAAARILAVRDSAIRDFVIDWQKRHLAPRYTRDAICAQLLTGLADTRAYRGDGAVRSPQASGDEGGRSASQSELAIEITARIRALEEAASAIELPPEAVVLPREIPANYMTLYDLQAYNAILEVSALDTGLSDPRGLWLPAARFARSLPGSVPTRDGWTCPLEGVNGHIVFGPYLRFPQGRYEVEFELGIRGVEPDASGDLTVDVWCPAAGQLAAYRYEPQRRLPVANAVLEFDNEDPKNALEFRIYATSFTGGILDFRGVYLRKKTNQDPPTLDLPLPSGEDASSLTHPSSETDGLAERFRAVFNTNVWADAETRSGPGSRRDSGSVADALSSLNFVKDNFGYTSISDIPCGDFNWMGEFLEAHPDICYCGFDIVLEMIDQNRKTFPTYRFAVLDITSSTPSRADLIFSKDLFNHLKFSDVRKALTNMKRSGSTYLLASNNFGRANDELSEDNYGASRFLDLCAGPFNLPSPIWNTRYMGLWKLSEICVG